MQAAFVYNRANAGVTENVEGKDRYGLDNCLGPWMVGDLLVCLGNMRSVKESNLDYHILIFEAGQAEPKREKPRFLEGNVSALTFSVSSDTIQGISCACGYFGGGCHMLLCDSPTLVFRPMIETATIQSVK